MRLHARKPGPARFGIAIPKETSTRLAALRKTLPTSREEPLPTKIYGIPRGVKMNAKQHILWELKRPLARNTANGIIISNYGGPEALWRIGMDVEDFHQLADIALMEAVLAKPNIGSIENWDGWARKVIRNSIIDEVRRIGFYAVKIPRSALAKRDRAMAIEDGLKKVLNRNPTATEVANKMNRPVHEVELLLNAFSTVDENQMHEILAVQQRSPEKARAFINGVKSRLSPQEVKAFMLYLDKELKMKQVADALGITESGVSRILGGISQKINMNPILRDQLQELEITPRDRRKPKVKMNNKKVKI